MTIQPGATFQEEVFVDELGACVAFAFEVENEAAISFSISHRPESRRGKASTLALLPTSTYSEHSGEVLLPGRGKTILSWHNPSGWLFSSAVDVLYTVQVRFLPTLDGEARKATRTTSQTVEPASDANSASTQPTPYDPAQGEPRHVAEASSAPATALGVESLVEDALSVAERAAGMRAEAEERAKAGAIDSALSIGLQEQLERRPVPPTAVQPEVDIGPLDLKIEGPASETEPASEEPARKDVEDMEHPELVLQPDEAITVATVLSVESEIVEGAADIEPAGSTEDESPSIDSVEEAIPAVMELQLHEIYPDGKVPEHDVSPGSFRSEEIAQSVEELQRLEAEVTLESPMSSGEMPPLEEIPSAEAPSSSGLEELPEESLSLTAAASDESLDLLPSAADATSQPVEPLANEVEGIIALQPITNKDFPTADAAAAQTLGRAGASSGEARVESDIFVPAPGDYTLEGTQVQLEPTAIILRTIRAPHAGTVAIKWSTDPPQLVHMLLEQTSGLGGSTVPVRAERKAESQQIQMDVDAACDIRISMAHVSTGWFYDTPTWLILEFVFDPAPGMGVVGMRPARARVLGEGHVSGPAPGGALSGHADDGHGVLESAELSGPALEEYLGRMNSAIAVALAKAKADREARGSRTPSSIGRTSIMSPLNSHNAFELGNGTPVEGQAAQPGKAPIEGKAANWSSSQAMWAADDAEAANSDISEGKVFTAPEPEAIELVTEGEHAVGDEGEDSTIVVDVSIETGTGDEAATDPRVPELIPSAEDMDGSGFGVAGAQHESEAFPGEVDQDDVDSTAAELGGTGTVGMATDSPLGALALTSSAPCCPSESEGIDSPGPVARLASSAISSAARAAAATPSPSPEWERGAAQLEAPSHEYAGASPSCQISSFSEEEPSESMPERADDPIGSSVSLSTSTSTSAPGVAPGEPSLNSEAVNETHSPVDLNENANKNNRDKSISDMGAILPGNGIHETRGQPGDADHQQLCADAATLEGHEAVEKTSLPVDAPRPLSPSALEVLEMLGLSKYRRKFMKEDVVETSMLLAMLALPNGKAELRAVLADLGMTVGHRERLLLALSTTA